MDSTAFYCVADQRYFLGAVGLVNSLRILGHEERIHLLDCGLTEAQRSLLENQVTLHRGSRATPPWLLKTVLPLSTPSTTMMLLDVDLVATRSLRPLLASAREGRLVAFLNPVQRYFPRWGELLDLGESRPRPYVSSAALAITHGVATRILGLMSELQGRVDFELTHWRRNAAGYPFAYADQDVLNAILTAATPTPPVMALPASLAPTPPFEGLRLVDERSLRCVTADGDEPFVVHHHTVKPWLEPTHHGVYSRLLRRLLVGDDLAIELPSRMIPPRLGRGLRGVAHRRGVNARQRLRWHLVEPLRRQLGRRP